MAISTEKGACSASITNTIPLHHCTNAPGLSTTTQTQLQRISTNQCSRTAHQRLLLKTPAMLNGLWGDPVRFQLSQHCLFRSQVSFSLQQLQAMLPKTLPEGLVDLIIMQCTEQQTVDNDHLWLEFDHAKIKVYNESAIRALYADLPRQCATCGLRFKAQEEHGQHMDWHVRKNRAAKKNIMSKQMQSRKWFPTSSFLLKASEVNGMPNACAPAFNSTGTVKEENNFEEPSAVFADEDQKNCPLCMEAFDEYFSDETNDWMYRGTVYMEEAKASTRRLYKSLVGRIVHAKCLYTKDEIQHLPNISG